MNAAALQLVMNVSQGTFSGAPATISHRYLKELRGSFADTGAYEKLLREGNPLVYSVSTVASASGQGQLHYAIGKLMPGRVGREYYLTKGHFHEWREAAEVYVGLQGEGFMLLEDEAGASRLLPIKQNGIVYVPGGTAHRTINTGPEPLVYLGVYPAAAGHDYDALASRNFRKIVIEQNGEPVLLDRSEFKP
jgi:glucose-6-phosphate isomerase